MGEILLSFIQFCVVNWKVTLDAHLEILFSIMAWRKCGVLYRKESKGHAKMKIQKRSRADAMAFD